MTISQDVAQMFCVAKGAGVARHENSAIPEEGKWIHAKEIKDISGLTHGVGWCAPQQGACKLTLNIKQGIIQEALVETMYGNTRALRVKERRRASQRQIR